MLMQVVTTAGCCAPLSQGSHSINANVCLSVIVLFCVVEVITASLNNKNNALMHCLSPIMHMLCQVSYELVLRLLRLVSQHPTADSRQQPAIRSADSVTHGVASQSKLSPRNLCNQESWHVLAFYGLSRDRNT